MIFLICLIFAEILILTYAAPKLGHPLFDPLTYEATFVKKNIPPSISNDAIRRFLRMPDKPDNTTKKPCQGYDYDDTLCKSLDGRMLCGYNKNLGQPKDPDAMVDLGNGCFSRGDRVECGYVTGPYQNSRRPPANNPGEKEHNIANLRSMNETITPEAIINASTERIKLMKILVNGQSTSTNKTVSSATTTSVSTTTLTTSGSFNNTLTIITAPITLTAPTTITLPTSTTTFNTTTLAKRNTTKTIVTQVFFRLLKKLAMETTTYRNLQQSSNSVKPRIMCVDKDNSIFCYELNGTKYFIY